MNDLSILFETATSRFFGRQKPLAGALGRPHGGRARPGDRQPAIRLRNAIGTHAGGYAIYRALAIAANALPSNHRPNLTDTAPADLIGPHAQWMGDTKIVSLDPWGHLVGEAFRDELKRGLDIRPTIAVTRAHIDMPEVRAAIAAGRIRPDGDIVSANGARARHEGRHRPGVVPARRRAVASASPRSRSAREPAREHRRHVSGAGVAPRPQGVPAADRRLDDLLLRRSGAARRPQDPARLPGARRMQRLRRVRLRHLHLPALSGAWRRALHRDGAGRRHRAHRLQSQGRPRARRGDEVPGLQCAQAPPWAATGRRPISPAPKAWRACATCASRS